MQNSINAVITKVNLREPTLEITKTVLSLTLVMITILTTLTLTTTIAAVYAGGDDDNNNEDGNKQKAEDDSAAAIADCDDNDVERAGFDCLAIATNDIEIETSEEEPPEESATLFVCKEVEDPPLIPSGRPLIPSDFEFVVTGPGGYNSGQFPGGPIDDPDPDCPPGVGIPGEVAPGEYVIEETDSAAIPRPNSIEVEGDCIQDPTNPRIATVEIQEGETGTLICTFTNIYEGGDS
jgi:hypothetical protein